MPAKYLMNWIPAEKRWQAKYHGKLYRISAAKLGCPPTKDQSYMAANLWWEDKRRELDAADRPDPTLAALQAADGGRLTEQRETGEAAAAVLFVKRLMDGADVEPEVAALLAKHLPPVMRRATGEATSEDRTLRHHVGMWLMNLRASVNVGNMDPTRYASYRRHIEIFADWIGEGADVSALTAAKLEQWWAVLGQRITEKRYSPAYAKTNLMTVKQFIGRLVELEVIPPVSNLRSKRLAFHASPKKIETFTYDEMRQVFRQSSDVAKLYWLLMLNCGMTQNDISELEPGEVDWKAGTITRKRSKRKEQENAQTVRYVLWPETFALLKKFGNRKGERVLLTEDGTALVRYWLDDTGDHRSDAINGVWTRLMERLPMERKAMKDFRKTSATALEKHDRFSRFKDYFLAHAGKTLAERHYAGGDDDGLAAAVSWLREALKIPQLVG